MSINIKMKDFLGDNYSIEDAILLREIVKNNLDTGVALDFEGLERIPSTFLICLFSDLINKFGREYIFKQIDVKNLSNYSDYSRVVLGTAFQQ
ncbi:STAS-like domain-containing protein [Clostridioides difficile]